MFLQFSQIYIRSVSPWLKKALLLTFFRVCEYVHQLCREEKKKRQTKK